MRDRREKFVDLATKRVNKVIGQLRLVGNLSNRSAYEFTDEDAKKIVKAIQKEVEAVKAKFANDTGNDNTNFRL